MDGLPADQGRDITDLSAHAIALVPVPVGDGVISETSVGGVTDECPQKKNIHPLGDLPEGEKSLDPVKPYRTRDDVEVQHEEPSQNDDHHDPVGPLQGPFGAFPQGDDHGTGDKDNIPPEEDRAFFCPSRNDTQLKGGDGRGCSQGPSGQTALAKSGDGKEPTPKRLSRSEPHKSNGNRLSGV